MATEALKRAVQKYDAANTTQVHLKLNNKTDAEIIDHLNGKENVQGYIKKLIRADMECARCEYWKECTKCIHEGDSLSKR